MFGRRRVTGDPVIVCGVPPLSGLLSWLLVLYSPAVTFTDCTWIALGLQIVMGLQDCESGIFSSCVLLWLGFGLTRDLAWE